MHSIIGPSTANYWAPLNGCTAYVAMAAHFPEEENIYGPSAKGTATHELAEKMIEAASRGGVGWPETRDWLGKLASNGQSITREMYEGAELYAKDVQVTMQDTGVFAAPYLMVEARVLAPSIHKEMWGTCDCFLFDPNSGTLYVWDYKDGRRDIEAFENWQLLCYVFGVIGYLELLGHVNDIKKIVMRIVQPNSYSRQGPIKTWELEPERLRPYYLQLIEQAKIVMSGQGVCRTGSHCRYCPARHACKALQEDATSAADITSQAVPEVLDNDALGTELAILKRAKEALEYRLSGLEAQATQAISGGERVRGWSLQYAKGREEWTDPATASACAQLIGFDINKPNELITPKQARDAGVPADLVARYSKRKTGSAKLKEDSKQNVKRIFTK